jgi:hypothetical protein
VPVLSRSLIDDRTGHRAPRGPGPQSNGHPRRPVNRTGFAPRGDSPRPAGGRNRFQRRARPSRPSEPILIPKLRIQFADFPYLHYSIDQRLFTLETCCGYGYELVRVRRNLPGIFKVPPAARGCRENCGTLRHEPKPILPARGFQGLGGLCRKDNSSQGSGGRLPVVSRCHDGYEGPNGSATRFWNMDQIPFRRLSSILNV